MSSDKCVIYFEPHGVTGTGLATMQRFVVLCALALVSVSAWSEPSCPEGTQAVCIENQDKICPGLSRCVDNSATCFDNYPCGVGSGFVCEAEYDKLLEDSQNAISEYDKLIAENVELRTKRLEQKNCILNAASLELAKSCVR
jgi:hypothetical protein